MQKISATTLARKSRDVLDAVVGGERIMVERNRILIAQIIPVASTVTVTQLLAEIRPTLKPSQAAAWLEASRKPLE